MYNKLFQKKLDSIIASKVNETVMYNKIYDMVSEEIVKYKKNLVTEGEDIRQMRKSVMNMLQDDKYNDAELMRYIWHPKDKKEEDTLRSLFSKMKSGKPDADGTVRHFNDKDITKLYTILRAR